jgi:hypothetical protein
MSRPARLRPHPWLRYVRSRNGRITGHIRRQSCAVTRWMVPLIKVSRTARRFEISLARS